LRRAKRWLRRLCSIARDKASGLQLDIDWDEALDVKIVIGDKLRGGQNSFILYGSRWSADGSLAGGGTNQEIVSDGELLTLILIADPGSQPEVGQIRFQYGCY